MIICNTISLLLLYSLFEKYLTRILWRCRIKYIGAKYNRSIKSRRHYRVSILRVAKPESYCRPVREKYKKKKNSRAVRVERMGTEQAHLYKHFLMQSFWTLLQCITEYFRCRLQMAKKVGKAVNGQLHLSLDTGLDIRRVQEPTSWRITRQ